MVITTFAVRKDTSKWMFVLLLTVRSVLLPLKDEMIRVIRGKSSIDRDMIQQLLDENQAAIQAAQDALTAAQNKLEEIEQENKKAENDCSNLFT